MREHIKRLLRVQSWIVYGVREEAGRLVVRVGKSRKGANCPGCREKFESASEDEMERGLSSTHRLVSPNLICPLFPHLSYPSFQPSSN